MAKKKQVVYPVVFMLIVTVVFVTILATLNSLTRDKVKKQAELEIKENILYVLNIEHEAGEDGIESAYKEHVKLETINDTNVYRATDNNQTVGFAFKISGAGLWGSMNGFAAVDATLTNLTGISFVSHSETPGLGGRVDEDWFKEQFRGLALRGDETIVYRPAADGNVDAIAGASLTSKAVKDIINQNVTTFLANVGGDLK